MYICTKPAGFLLGPSQDPGGRPTLPSGPPPPRRPPPFPTSFRPHGRCCRVVFPAAPTAARDTYIFFLCWRLPARGAPYPWRRRAPRRPVRTTRGAPRGWPPLHGRPANGSRTLAGEPTVLLFSLPVHRTRAVLQCARGLTPSRWRSAPSELPVILRGGSGGRLCGCSYPARQREYPGSWASGRQPTTTEEQIEWPAVVRPLPCVGRLE